MQFIHLGGTRGKGLFAIVDDQDAERVNRHHWSLHSAGYAKTNIRVDGARKVLYMHQLLVGGDSKIECDHKNGIRLDNRRGNLRPADRSIQNWNRAKEKRNTSGFKGAYYRPDQRKWMIGIGFQNHFYRIANTDDIEEGAHIYDQVAMQLFGEYARTNFDYTES